MDIKLAAAAALFLGAAYNYLVLYQQQNVQQSDVVVKKKRTRKRRCWMQAIHQERTRMSLNNQLAELLTEPTGQYFIHMSASDFEYLLHKISPIIKKQDTTWRDSIPPKIRLAVTLRYLATGDTYTNIHKFFKISNSLVSRIIPEVCKAITVVLKDCIQLPTCPEEWETKTKGFRFPHCVGALDGKHITIWAPSHTGPEDLNYQGNFSMVLLTLVDSDYTFMYADSVQSQNTDHDVFNETELWHKICTNELNLPTKTKLPGENSETPFVFLTNGAFPLKTSVMKPFLGQHPPESPENMFDQVLLQSHGVVDNAFGILSAVFRVFLKPICVEPRKCSSILRTCLLLHNLLIKSDSSRDIYCPPGLVDTYFAGELVTQGSWRHDDQDHFQPIQRLPCSPKEDALQIRMNFVNYIYKNSLDKN